MVQTWKYHTQLISVPCKVLSSGFEKETARFNEFLNAAGGDGWELVGLYAIGATELLQSANHFMAVLKRPAS